MKLPNQSAPVISKTTGSHFGENGITPSDCNCPPGTRCIGSCETLPWVGKQCVGVCSPI